MLVLLTAVAVTACSSNESSSGKLKVVATIFPYYDLANNISGSYADVQMLLKAGSDVHSFEPTADDIKAIQNCDIFIYNGGESDAWVDDILDSLDKDNSPKILKMMDYVTLVNEKDADHNQGKETDEHIWTSLLNMENLTGIIESAMADKDSTHSSDYKTNSKNYIKEIYTVSNEIKSVVTDAKNKKIIVADRFPLIYFTNQYGLEWECAFPGCSSETEPSLSRISKLKDSIDENNINYIFQLDMSENKVADTLSEETGAKVLTFYSCETISQTMLDAGETYSTLMMRNLSALKEALS
jgi:zinc transport system substrate-binding protein